VQKILSGNNLEGKVQDIVREMELKAHKQVAVHKDAVIKKG